ncbi:hypothetical protein JW960_12030 [candidate division KSB1 bacterium]|nr:hypothetical protein [candidate division KSB1 bacterium]
MMTMISFAKNSVLKLMIHGLNLYYWFSNRKRTGFTQQMVISSREVKTALPLDGPKFMRYPSFVIENDLPYLVSYGFQNGWRIFVQRNFRTPVCLTPDSGYQNNKGPSAVFYGGFLYIAFHSGFRGHRQIKVAKSNHTLIHIDEVTIVPDGLKGDMHYPFLTVNNDTMFLLFSIRRESYRFENYYVIVNDSLKWSKPHRVQLPGTQGRRLQCVCDENGLFYVTWETYGKVYLGISSNFKRWEVADIIDVNSYRPRISKVGELIRIVYEKHTDDINQIKLATWCKSSIHYETLYESCDYLSRPSNIIDVGDHTLVAWTSHQIGGEQIFYRQMKVAPVVEPEYIFEEVYE